jgi:hypothetical protein
MQPIRTRYDELEKITVVNLTEEDLFKTINEEYFNYELKIDIDSQWTYTSATLTASTMGISMYYTVNNQTFVSRGLFIEYLQSIYDLKHIQKQIKRINEKVS